MAVSANEIPVMRRVFAAVAAFWATASAVAIPPATGPYNVGVRTEVIEHYNDHDFLAPNNVSTSFLATFYYPTAKSPAEDTGPYLHPATARVWEAIYGYEEGVLAAITSTLQPKAPFLKPSCGKPLSPTLLWGPGAAGPATEAASILLSELASYGYTVIGLDHPYEHEVLPYPNGTVLPGIPLDYPWTFEELELLQLLRLEDATVFLEKLPALAEELGAPINTTHIGTFGHSLGGSAAIESLLYSDALKSGINLDGTFFGRLGQNSSDVNIKKPTLLLGFEEHFDYSWDSFPHFQTGYFRNVHVNGTVHNDFTDVAFWKIVGSDAVPVPGELTIGKRMVHIVRTLVKAFFDFTLLNGEKPAILDGPFEGFPELWYFNKNGVPIN